MIQKLSGNNYEDFVGQRRVAVVHFDTDWDVAHCGTRNWSIKAGACAIGAFPGQIPFTILSCSCSMTFFCHDSLG